VCGGLHATAHLAKFCLPVLIPLTYILFANTTPYRLLQTIWNFKTASLSDLYRLKHNGQKKFVNLYLTNSNCIISVEFVSFIVSCKALKAKVKR